MCGIWFFLVNATGIIPQFAEANSDKIWPRKMYDHNKFVIRLTRKIMLVLWSVLIPVTIRKKPRVGSLSYQGVLFSNAIIFLTYESHFKSTVVGGSIPKKYLPSIVKTSVSACQLSAKICY